MDYSPLIPRDSESPSIISEKQEQNGHLDFEFQDVDFDEIKKFPLDLEEEDEGSSVIQVENQLNNQKQKNNKKNSGGSGSEFRLFRRSSSNKSKSISDDVSPYLNEKQKQSDEKSEMKKSTPIEIKNSPAKSRENNNKRGSGSSSGGRISFFKVLTRRNSTTNQGKHKKLEDQWMQAPEPVLDGVTFCVKFLGSTLIEKSGASDAAEATKTVIQMVKAGHKPARLGLTVCTNGITLSDPSTGEIRLEISIYDIAHCSADANYPNVFSFIATNKNDVNECYCFATRKRKMAQHITLTIAQAFNLAFELWQSSSVENSGHEDEEETLRNYSSSLVSNSSSLGESSSSRDVKVIIGSTDSAKSNASTGSNQRDSSALSHSQWVHFDTEEKDVVDDITNHLNSISMVTLSPFHKTQGNPGQNRRRDIRHPQNNNEDLLICLN